MNITPFPWTLWTHPIMLGWCKGSTTPHRCVTVNDLKRNQPSDRDRQARHKLQEKTSDFNANFYYCISGVGTTILDGNSLVK